MRKSWLTLLFSCLFVFLTGSTVHADWPVYEDDIRADTLCVMEAETGVVLMDRDMNAQMYPASVTKMLTTLVAIENGNLEDEVVMSEEACAYVTSDSSNLNCQVGEIFKLGDLLYGVMIASANEMATQVAIHVGGSVEQFCEMMNARAAEIGCTGTHFVNANGMPDDNHVTTARDMALVLREAIKNDTFRKIINTPAYTIAATNLSEPRGMSSHNALLLSAEYMLPGIIGGKTGFTYSALHTLVNAAERDDMTLIVSTFRTADATRTVTDQIALFEFFFENYEKLETPYTQYAQGNGHVILPKGVSLENATAEEEISQDSNGSDRLIVRYTYDGRNCGTVELSAESYAAYLKDMEEKAKSDEESKESAAEAEEPEPEDDEDDEARLARRQRERDAWARQFYILVGVAAFVCLVLVITVITLLIKIIVTARKK